MHPQGRVVGNRVYYGNYNGGPCSPQNRPKCLLILFCVLFVLIGFIITIIGFTLKPFWDESHDSWCSFCKEDRLQTERDTANCRIAGPIILSMGILLIIFTCCYVKNKKKNTAQNDGNATTTTQGAIRVQYNQASVSYGETTSTTIHPPPSSAPTYPTSGPAMTTQQYPSPQYPPHQAPPQSPYPPPLNPTAPYPQRQGPPYPPSSDTMMPPPPSYNDATGYEKKC